VRGRAYFGFEVVAWPEAAWCTFELMLRVVTGATGGVAGTGLIAASAALTIVAVRWRNGALAAAVVETRER